MLFLYTSVHDRLVGMTRKISKSCSFAHETNLPGLNSWLSKRLNASCGHFFLGTSTDRRIFVSIIIIFAHFTCRPTELDALVFGHLFTVITTTLPDNRLAKTVQQFNNLVAFCQNIERRFFKEVSGVGDVE